MDYYGFYTGQEFEAYRYLGAHLEGGGSTTFRTFAPNARRIEVIGDFNGWAGTPMEKVYDGNFWECRVEGAEQGMRYKYRITGRDGRTLDHCDPYGFASERRPQTASIIWPLDTGYCFGDHAWMRTRTAAPDRPLNIYELHFGSWRKKGEGSEDWYSYRELGELLIPYMKDHGYNCLEMLPLCEHPSDQSWGYQATGFFCPTSRYGSPEDLRFFIDQCHQAGLGVLLDFAPVHFAVDDYALLNYDGTALYEYPHTDVGRSEWGSCNFMHSRGEVRSFLQSAAYYWLKEFHFDGLRMDAVSNLIYWQGRRERGENQAAIAFLRTMNEGLKKRIPSAVLIAEDSSAFPGVTRPVSEGGLGFDYKWDMGWMNDTLAYFRLPPNRRREQYHKLTFSMQYFRNERYLLPLSHDEVVHGKGTILQKMNGDYSVKFPQARALYLYMMAHPGKKLNFMGSEFGQLREWDERREQDWMLLQYPNHSAFLRFLSELNAFYLGNPAMYQGDYTEGGFAWIDCHQEDACIYVFQRRCPTQRLIFLFNFSDREQEYLLRNEGNSGLRVALHTEWERYGGREKENQTSLRREGENLRISLPRFSGLCLW